jgi:hypothetical protein
MVIRVDIEIWENGKGGIKRGTGKGVGGWKNWYGGCWVLWPLCMSGCIFVVVVEGVSGNAGGCICVQFLQ